MTLVETIAMPLCGVVALATCWVASSRMIFASEGRFVSLDGLRGFMALIVFINHCNVWFNYVHSGEWNFPTAYNHLNLAGVGVAVFFAITGFLFCVKLDQAGGRLNWGGFFVTRIMRIYPAYVCVGLLVALLVMTQSGFLSSGLIVFPAAALDWLTFGYSSVFVRALDPSFTPPDLPGVETGVMVSHVFWSLPYEVFFYAALPILALLMNGRPHPMALLVGMVGCVALYKIDHSLSHQVFFLSGMIAAALHRLQAFKAWARTPLANALALSALLYALIGTPETWGVTPALLAITAAFAIIANGASLFGLLTSRAAKLLGEISYSVYILHGLVLYVCFNLLIGLTRAGTLTPAAHWIIAIALAPVVVLLSLLMYRHVELPGIRFGKALSRWLAASKGGLNKGIEVEVAPTDQ